MKYIISGGGTGGHIYPAIAILEEIKNRDKSAQILYVGNEDSMEKRIADEMGLDFKAIRVKGMPRKLNMKFFKALGEMFVGLSQSFAIVKDFQPDLVIGTGGFVTGPILLAASLSKKKTLIHEQNSLPGVANRILSRFVDVVCATYEASIRYFAKPERVVVTGNPIRASFADIEVTDQMYQDYGLSKDKPIVFIFGGSNGSEDINAAVSQMLNDREDLDFQLILATGRNHYKDFLESIGSRAAMEGLSIKDYLYDIGSAYGICDLVITSSGAISLAEISSLGLASILIPKSYTAENHQEYNARLYEDRGASTMILEKNLNGQVLYEAIMNILNNKESLALMGKNARKLANDKATDDIIDQVEKLVQGGKNGR